jgi:3-deoxy-D-manno-octulosonic-acid transferase
VLLARRGRHYLASLPGRLGGHRGPVVAQGLWLHAVSVGEAAVAATLARALPAGIPLVVTTITPTGHERARTAFAGSTVAGPDGARRAAVAYLPFELGFAVERFFARFAPRALVLVEGDYWPLVLRAARRRGLPVVVVNGRVSDRSFPRLVRLARLLPAAAAALFGAVDRFGVQSGEDRNRLLAVGVAPERVVVTGNLKFDSPEPPRRPDLEARLAELAQGRPVLVAGSTMGGEEEAVAEAFAALGGGGRALLVVAPRHPERFDEVARLLARRGSAVARRSAPTPGLPRPDILLLDTLGELAAVYRGAAGAFIGGTLVATGGHNPLEPARFGVPIAVGPSMDNFRDMAARFDAGQAWRRVAGAADLGAVWRAWLDDPAAARAVGERARALVEENRGALSHTLALLEPMLREWNGTSR